MNNDKQLDAYAYFVQQFGPEESEKIMKEIGDDYKTMSMYDIKLAGTMIYYLNV